MTITPFNIAISDAALSDLQQRLSNTRWLDTMPDSGWNEGCDAEFLKRAVTYWREGFDWRVQEKRLNALGQFMTDLDGQTVHFVHRRGIGPEPLPLILTNGWPGSFVEMAEIIPLLADPGSHGGDPNDAFHVVVPSLPGYGFSPAPTSPGTGPLQVAELWAKLMTRLGYERFGAQGGDWGAGVSTWLALQHPQRVTGLHLNFIPGSYRPPLTDAEPPITVEEQAFVQKAAAWIDAEGGYARIQGTKPQSLAFGLNDSPVGLAAWILEKFHGWSGFHGDIEQGFGLDELLTNLSVYWFTGSIGSSFRLYLEARARPLQLASGQRVLPPLGVAQFPDELPMPPRSWLERCFDVQRWTLMPHGGHFAAMERPQDLAEEIRAFFRPLR